MIPRSQIYSISDSLKNNMIASPMQAYTASYYASNTRMTVQTYYDGISRLSNLVEKTRMRTLNRLTDNPLYRGGRANGVRHAWEYERLDIQLGGNGSETWMAFYKNEILQNGKVNGAQGHHRKNVANHPVEQSNPDNIKFYKTQKDHLNKGHNGDWHNESDMPMIDRGKMVQKTKNKTIVKNEVLGASVASAIGFAVTATMSFIIELSKNGASYEDIKNAAIIASEDGLYGAGFGAGSYFIYRSVEFAADYAVQKSAIHLSEKALKGVKGSIAAAIIISGTSIYNYSQLRKDGYSVQNSLIEIGKQAALPTIVLALSYLPPPFGPSVAVSSLVGYVFWEWWDVKFEKE